MPDSSFVHLHVHTHYSLLDGATRINALVDRAKEYNMPAVAITDHGNMFGAIEFYTAARKAGVKPIIGCETYLAPRDRRSKEGVDGKQAYHQLLLAMNLEGYHNLIRLSSIGYTEGFFRKPRIDKEVLREFSAGLICTSTCLSGEIPSALLNRDRATADELAKTYLEIFGPDRFFIELQDHTMPEQRMLNPELIDMAQKLGVATIATNDVHYLDHDDVESHDVLCCINTAALVSDENRFRFPSDQFFFKSTEEMTALFPDCPEAIGNTLRVAEMCNLELDLTKRHAPVYRVASKSNGKDGGDGDPASYLRKLVYEGAGDRYGDISEELHERIDYELEVITSKGFASYFLIVWDCVKYACQQGIPVKARGSGCSSVVAYCLRICSVDPILYDLYFERFMDPDRDEMPDIDLDICQDGRATLIDYVREKYGHVAQIITFGTLKARAAVKDVSRVMGLGFDEANELTKLIPAELKMTLDKALAQEPELKKRYEQDPRVKRIIDIARRLEGVARNAGVHAAGVVVADQPLTSLLPLYRSDKQETLVTQFDGPTVEKVGLLKMDFLGLRTLTTLERARRLAEEHSGRTIDLEQLDLTDARVYELFARGDTRGVFQFESGGMRDVIMRIKPNRIHDLIAANALFRPGPMEYIPEYVARKHGAPWTTPHPIMSEVLQETYGIMVYQEQVSRIVNRLGGIELKAAFRLAKAISKKKTEMIEAMREPFLTGCAANGVKRGVAEETFADILKFGGYAFNKAHSTGYALIAFQTAWMKTYFPVEFMTALLTLEMSSTDKVAEYREDCKGMGIQISPPDINTSEFDFTVQRHGSDSRSTSADHNRSSLEPVSLDAGAETQEPADRVIRFGLGAIRGVGSKAVEAIVSERRRSGEFIDLFDMCERVDLSAANRAAIEALICAGAFDRTGCMRKALVDALDRGISAGQRAQEDRRTGQMGLFGGESEATPACGEALIGNEEWSEADMLAREKAVLGFYITKHPLASFEQLLRVCGSVGTTDLSAHGDGDVVVLGGMISGVRMVTAKGGRNAGKSMAIVTLEDLQGRVEAIVFPSDLITYRSLLVPDSVAFLEGSVDRKREEPSLRTSRVVPASEAVSAFARALILDVNADTPLERVVQLVREHPGECAVYLNVSAPNDLVAQIECHPSLNTTCTPPMISELVDILGEGSICILGPAKRTIPVSLATTPADSVAQLVPV